MLSDNKFTAYLRLMRPANIVTALADILTGYAIALGPMDLLGHVQIPLRSLILLLITTMGLYGGGVVFNDVCDAQLDAKERPERPIPRGLVTRKQGALLGTSLFLIALIASYQVSMTSFILAMSICVLCLSYDMYSKHHAWLGPLNMASCRAFNLLLGMSILDQALENYWFVAFIPFIFISAITLVGKGEVSGGNKRMLMMAMTLYIATLASLLALARFAHFRWLETLPFLLLFILFSFTPLIKAIKNSSALIVRQAVKAGVLSLIVLGATMAAGFTSIYYGLLILMLLPLSLVLAKKFAVT